MRDLAAMALAMAGLIPAGQAMASGFALKEQSSTAMGYAFAGATAGAEDISFMFFNPAALGRVEKVEAMAVQNIIMPSTQLESASATTAGGDPIPGRGELGNPGISAIVPALYTAAPIGEDWRIGLAINTPFGLGTDYPGDWVGRYHGLDTNLLTINLNPVVAYKPASWLSLGAGLQIQYVEAQLSSAIDFATALSAGPAGTLDGTVELEGNDIGAGFTAGILADVGPATRIGLGYRSKVDHTIRGNGDFTVPAALAPIPGGGFVNTPIKAALETPASASIGIFHEISPSFALTGEVQWTQWSSFDDLIIRFDNPAQADSVTEESWDDTWFFAAGARWRPSDTLVLRAGVAYDQTPVKTKHRTPRVPDNDRMWVSAGLAWQPTNWITVDLSYTHIFVDETEIRLSSDDVGNAARGNLDAKFDSSIDLVSASVKLSF